MYPLTTRKQRCERDRRQDFTANTVDLVPLHERHVLSLSWRCLLYADSLNEHFVLLNRSLAAATSAPAEKRLNSHRQAPD